MPSYAKIEKETVLKAIKSSQGLYSVIAKRIGCVPKTAENLCNRWQETRDAVEEETEFILDMAESVVFRDISSGSVATAKWYLLLKGKKRGYDAAATLKLDNGEPLNIKFEGLTKSQVEDASNIEIGGADESTDI